MKNKYFIALLAGCLILAANHWLVPADSGISGFLNGLSIALIVSSLVQMLAVLLKKKDTKTSD